MNWAVLRREWGAVTFVLTVVAGLIVVPVALYFAGVGPGQIATPNLPVATSARASTVHSPSPSPTPSPSHSPTPTPKK